MSAERELFIADGIGNRHLYSAAVRYGDLIWISGQTAQDESGAVPDDFTTQVVRTLDNVERALRTAGGDLGTLLKVTTYLSDIDDFALYSEVYRRRIADVGLPARTSVEVSRFQGAIRIEMEAVGHVRRGR